MQKHIGKLEGACGIGCCSQFAVNVQILSLQLCKNGRQKMLPSVSVGIFFGNVILVVHCEFREFFLFV